MTKRRRFMLAAIAAALTALSTEAFAPASNYHDLTLARTKQFRSSSSSTSSPSSSARSGSSSPFSNTQLFAFQRKPRRYRSFKGDSMLAETNSRRVALAGRKGSKRFVDPTKVFVGNLPFNATEEHMLEFFSEHLGHTQNIHSIKIIRDWKTGKSKGYAFVLFSDPMFATCAMEFCKNKQMLGRILSLNQGKKKLDPNTLYVKKKKQSKPVDEEEAAIEEGLAEAADELSDLQEFDDVDDAELFDDEENADDDDVFDGVFEDFYPERYEPLTEEELQLNREKRRDIARRKKRRKLPHKGFEPN